MNKIFRNIWCDATQTWVAVAEIARTQGGPASSAAAGHLQADGAAASSPWDIAVIRPLSLALALGLGQAVFAAPPTPPAASQLPTGGQVAAGAAQISAAAGNTLNIDQSSQRAVVNWQTFNVGSAATVNFNQPNASAVTLNRVLSSDPSQIFGRINSSGQVFLTNPAGIYFAPGASANVGSLVATTHSIADADFMAGGNTLHLTRNGATGVVQNDGTLTASLGGYIALLAPEVRNQGVIVAPMGTVALAAGEAYQLQFQGPALAGVAVSPSALQTLIDNGNAIQAPGGQVILSARGMNALQGSVVNSGSIEASSLTNKGGSIVLEGDAITLKSGSSLKADGATGGGTVLVGGDWQGSTDMHQATNVTMEQGAGISANATSQGDGGKVVLWSDVHKDGGLTTANGSVSAQGLGAASQGGQVETSGHSVEIDGFSVNTLAQGGGKTGLWLIDPYDYTIGLTQAATISTALALTSVTVDTSTNNIAYGSSGNSANAGNITVASAINAAGSGGLTLLADGGVTVNSGAAISIGGPLLLNAKGGAVNVGASLTTNNAGAGITLKARDHITMAQGASAAAPFAITTNGGDITLWSNATGAAVGGAGYVYVKDNNRLDSRTNADRTAGNTSTASGGGAITLGGGSASQTLASGTVVPTGAAWNGTQVPSGGVGLGSEVSQFPRRGHDANIAVYSGGGNISFNGYGTNGTFQDIPNSVGRIVPGIGIYQGVTIDAGVTGNITMTGSANGGTAYAQGLDLGRFSSGTLPLLIKTHNGNISINGTATGNSQDNYGVQLQSNNALAPIIIESTGTGSISITGNAAAANRFEFDIYFLNANILASSGVINFTGSGPGNIAFNGLPSTIGQKAGSDVTASSSNITVTDDQTTTYYSAGTKMQSGGILTLKPYSVGTGIDVGFNNASTTRLQFAASLFNGASRVFQDGFSQIIIGRPDGTGLINLGATATASTTTFTDNLTLTQASGGINLNGVLDDTGNTAMLVTGATATEHATNGGIKADKLALKGNGTAGAGTFNLGTSAKNLVNTLAAGNDNGSAVGAVTFKNSQALAIGTVNAIAGINSTGAVLVTTNTGDLTLANNISTTDASSSAITLNAGVNTSAPQALGTDVGGNLLVNGGATLTTGAGGRATLYTGSVANTPAATVALAGAGHYRYGSDETTTSYNTATNPLGTGTYLIYREQPIANATINPETITYGDALPSWSWGLSGAINGDTLSWGTNPTGVSVGGSTSSSGNYTVGAHSTSLIGGAESLGYKVASSGTLTVNPKAITLSGITASDKVYDGNTSVTLNTAGATFVGKVGSDVLTLNSASGSFSDKNAGTNKTVNLSETFGGADAGNYTIAQQASATASITPKALTVAGTTVASKVYDGNTAASVSGGALVGVIGGDAVTLMQAGTFATQNAANNITVTTADSLGGGDSGNYTLTQPTGLSANITPKTVTAAIAANNKVYDGTVVATLNSQTVSGTVGAETLNLNVTDANFDTPNVGGGKTVTASGLSLADGTGLASNYTLAGATTATTTATIGQRALTVTANNDAQFVTLADNTSYNGVNYSGFVNGETAAVLGGTASITRTNIVGNGSSTTAGTYANVLLPSGLTSSNYAITFATGNYTVVPANQLLVRTSNTSTVYGNATTPTVNFAGYMLGNNSVVDLTAQTSQTGTHVTVTDGASGSASFDLVPTAPSYSTSSNLSVGNYATSASAVSGNTANFNNNLVLTGNQAVTQAPLTLGSSAQSKTYDGTTTLTGLVVSPASGAVSGDLVTASGSGAFDTRNAGSGYTVNNLSVAGADAGNYYIANSNGTITSNNATINKAALTLTALSDSKVYDGNTTSNQAVQISGLVGSDTVTGLTESFNSKNVLNATTLSVDAGYTVNDGNGGGNYTVTTNTASGTITPKTLTVNGSTAADKVYDGNQTAAVSGGVLQGVVGSDAVTLTQAGTFATKDVDNSIAVTATDSLNGADIANYTLTQPTGLIANITPKTVTAAVTADDKTYDGNTTATLSSQTVSGMVGSETLALNATGANFNDANAATGKTVTASGLSLSDGTGLARNYTLAGTTTATTTANITPKTVTAAVTANDKTYDANTTATLSSQTVSGMVGSETLALNVTGANFNDANAAAGKTVTASGLALADGSGLASNYTLAGTTTATTTATINKAALTLTALTDSKVYDGNTTSNQAVQVSGLVGSDTVTGLTESFNSKNVLNATTLSVDAGYTVNDGNGGGNYTVTTNTASGTITPKTLTVNGSTAADKVYDGNQTAAVSGGVLQGVVGSDAVTLTQAGTFATKDVDNSIAVTATDSLNGADIANYTLTQPTGLIANITPKTVTAAVTADDKTYDGNTTATLSSQTVSGMVGSETLALNATGANFNDANAATGKTVTASGLSLSDGTGLARNYTLAGTTTATTTANITPKTVTAAVTANDKTYDANTTATLSSQTVSGMVGSETLALNVTGANFNDANAAAGKTVTASGLALADGSGLASNYTLAGTTTATTTATINKAALTLTALTDSKVYDGNTTSNQAVQVSGLVGSDTVTGLTESFNSKNVLNAATLSVDVGYTVNDGNGGGNYAVTANAAPGTITPKAVSVTGLAAQDKTYDGSTSVTISNWGGVSTGVGSETLTLDTSNARAGFTSANPGNAVPVTASGYALANGSNGGLASNYALASANGVNASTTATISPAPAPNGGNSGVPPSPVVINQPPSQGVFGWREITHPDNVVVNVVALPTLNADGAVMVYAPREMATTGVGFSFPLPPELSGLIGETDQVTLTAPNGDRLPSGLRYVPETRGFEVSAVLGRGLPISITLSTERVRIVVVLTERQS